MLLLGGGEVKGVIWNSCWLEELTLLRRGKLHGSESDVLGASMPFVFDIRLSHSNGI